MAVLGRSVKKFGSFLKFSSSSGNRGYSLHLQQVKVLHLQQVQCLQMAKSLISPCRRIGETVLKQLSAKPTDNCCCSLFSKAATGSVL